MSKSQHKRLAWIALLGGVVFASCDKPKDLPSRCMEYRTFSAERAQNQATSTARVRSQDPSVDTIPWTIEQMRMVLGVDGVRSQDFDPVFLCSNVDERIRRSPGYYSKRLARHDMVCAERLLGVGRYDQALHHLERIDSVSENDPTFQRDSFGEDWKRTSRDALHSILTYDLGNCHEAMEKLLTSQSSRYPVLQLCLREVHSPTEIIEELDRSVDRVVVGPFQQAPLPIQKSLRTYGIGPGIDDYAWTIVFGMHHLLPLPYVEDTHTSREKFIERYKSEGLYGQMYCLPNTRDSLELERQRKMR
ncbi:MAG TPA: hypothetical protein PKY05_15665 [Fibrobacteria bacterium]|nr:hypothetical protein [Fibrobacteria bacterium]